jgi:hypothetical protein
MGEDAVDGVTKIEKAFIGLLLPGAQLGNLDARS